eukprot:m.310168 g.310168  ORF g.310168 m.310168 type:complete len:614 (+) comp50026_c0_seq1:42-1883(+)
MADNYYVFQALYTFQGRTPEELSFMEGEYFYVAPLPNGQLPPPDLDGWMQGRHQTGQNGIFHEKYAEMVSVQPPANPAPRVAPQRSPYSPSDSFSRGSSRGSTGFNDYSPHQDTVSRYVQSTERRPSYPSVAAEFPPDANADQEADAYVQVQRRPGMAPQIPSNYSSFTAVSTMPWYWGNISSEKASDLLEGEADGAFLVRDHSRTPGNFTLSVKKDGMTKRIQIYHRNGKYGFSEPLAFFSVPDLVEKYQNCSLAEHNSGLDVCLMFPKMKNQPSMPVKPVQDTAKMEELMQELRGATDEYERQNREFNRATYEIERLTDELDTKKKYLLTFQSVVDILAEQESLLQRNRTQVMSDVMHVLVQNMQLIGEKKRAVMEEMAAVESFVRGKENDLAALNERAESVKVQAFEQNSLKAGIMMELGGLGLTSDNIKRRLFALKKADKDIQMEGRQIKKRQQDDTYVQSTEEEEDIDAASQMEDVYYDIYGTTQDLIRDDEDGDWLIHMDRDQSNRGLSGCPDGTFLVRPRPSAHPSDHHQYTLVISFQGQVNHIKILCEDGWFGFTAGSCTFNSLRDLVRHYQTTSLHQHNRKLTITLETPYNRIARGGPRRSIAY